MAHNIVGTIAGVWKVCSWWIILSCCQFRYVHVLEHVVRSLVQILYEFREDLLGSVTSART